MNQPCFVTGGSGFIGQHLLALLTRQGHSATLLMRQPQTLPALRAQIEQLGGRGELLTAVAGDLGRCVSFVSRAAFHVASGIQCPPGLEILLPDVKESSQGSRTRPGSPTKRRSRRGIVSGNVLVATLWPCLACART